MVAANNGISDGMVDGEQFHLNKYILFTVYWCTVRTYGTIPGTDTVAALQSQVELNTSRANFSALRNILRFFSVNLILVDSIY